MPKVFWIYLIPEGILAETNIIFICEAYFLKTVAVKSEGLFFNAKRVPSKSVHKVW